MLSIRRTVRAAAQMTKMSAHGSRKTNVEKVFVPEPSNPNADPHTLYTNLVSVARSNCNSDLIRRYIEATSSMMQNGKMTGKDTALIVHAISGLPKRNLTDLDREIGALLDITDKVLRKTHKLRKSLVAIDIALIANTVARFAKVDNGKYQRVASSILKTVGEEIPLKLGYFEDQHLAKLMHAFAALKFTDSVLVNEIVTEIQMSRGISSFAPQSVVMIASALSRLRAANSDKGVDLRPIQSDLWLDIMRYACRIKRGDMQANWPDVFLASVSFSGLPVEKVDPVFLDKMTIEVKNQFDSRLIAIDRVMKAASTLVALKASPETISRLRSIIP